MHRTRRHILLFAFAALLGIVYLGYRAVKSGPGTPDGGPDADPLITHVGEGPGAAPVFAPPAIDGASISGAPGAITGAASETDRGRPLAAVPAPAVSRPAPLPAIPGPPSGVAANAAASPASSGGLPPLPATMPPPATRPLVASTAPGPVVAPPPARDDSLDAGGDGLYNRPNFGDSPQTAAPVSAPTSAPAMAAPSTSTPAALPPPIPAPVPTTTVSGPVFAPPTTPARVASTPAPSPGSAFSPGGPSASAPPRAATATPSVRPAGSAASSGASPRATPPSRTSPGVAAGSSSSSSPAAPTRAPGGPGAGGERRDYVVKAGDTLSTIALNELGSARRWEEIARLNRAALPDPNRLTVGTKIVLPVDAPAPATPAVRHPAPGSVNETPAPTAPVIRLIPPITEDRYAVQAGDTLAAIAQARYRDPKLAGRIMQVNQKILAATKGRLEVGMVLSLPPLPAEAVAPATTPAPRTTATTPRPAANAGAGAFPGRLPR